MKFTKEIINELNENGHVNMNFLESFMFFTDLMVFDYIRELFGFKRKYTQRI